MILIYSASMKSYHFWNFDILKIIKEIWTGTLHFVFLVNYRRAYSNKTVLLALQLGSSCCTWILCFSRFIKMWKHYFQKQICQSMPDRYSLKTPSKWFRLFHQIGQARLRLSGTTIAWQVPIELNGNIWCPLVKGYCAFGVTKPFSVVPIHRNVHHKNENWTDGNSLSWKIQMCSCVKCTRVSGNFSLMLSISSHAHSTSATVTRDSTVYFCICPFIMCRRT